MSQSTTAAFKFDSAPDTAMNAPAVYLVGYSRPKSWISLVVLWAGICAVWLAGCATENPPPPPPKRVVQSPESGLNNLDLVARATPPVGGVLPVQIAVTNVTVRSLSLDAQGIRAQTTSGTSVATVSPDQAIELAGGAQKLARALSEVYLVHVAGHQKEPSRAQSALAACLAPLVPPTSFEGPGAGQAAAGWIMFVCPIVFGGAAAKSLAVASSPSLQVSDVALPGGDLTPGDEKRGYIFLPLGNYKAIEVPVEDTSTDSIETIVQPWDSAADLASTTALKQASAADPEIRQPSGPSAPQSIDGDRHEN
jgi:hypothetical protein